MSQTKQSGMSEPRIVTFDIETTPIQSYTWDLYPNAISHDSIVSDFSLICAAWKYLGEPTVYDACITKVHDDYKVVKKLRDVLADADVVIGHNIDKFDLKKLNARLIYHKLPPLPKLVTIDTRKVAKKLGGFTSNRLDYLGKHLLGQGKLHVDYQLWVDIMSGNKAKLRAALDIMLPYNRVDVVRNEELYLRFRPYMTAHPHTAVLQNKEKSACPKCGSIHTQKRGISITNAGTKYQRLQCQDCGGWHQVVYKPTK